MSFAYWQLSVIAASSERNMSDRQIVHPWVSRRHINSIFLPTTIFIQIVIVSGYQFQGKTLAISLFFFYCSITPELVHLHVDEYTIADRTSVKSNRQSHWHSF